jgi:hypothetical protein
VTQILVVKDVGLWISLNRYFAGTQGVRLSEASTLETGLRLARIERPDVVVCSTESLEQDADELQKTLSEIPDSTRVLCVDRSAPSGIPAQARFMPCRPERFLDAAGLLAERRESAAATVTVDLLAHFEMPSPGGIEPRRGFANVVELAVGELLMESDDALALGDRLDLTFFVPATASGGSARKKVSLRCEVQECPDEGKLRYRARSTALDEESQESLERYIAQMEHSSGRDA